MSIVIQVKNIESKKFDWWIFDIHKIINKKKKIIFWLHLLHQAVVIKHICSVIEDWAVNLNMYGFFCKSYAGDISSKTNIWSISNPVLELSQMLVLELISPVFRKFDSTILSAVTPRKQTIIFTLKN